jgi:OFA family oxalate/formate antiporter-like MFS transporter
VLAAGVMLSSQATTLGSLILCNGVLFGAGLGLAYSPPITASARYFPDHKGLATGIIVSGFGGGAFIFGSFATWLVNPNGLGVDPATSYFAPDGPVASRVPLMYLCLGAMYAVLVTVGGNLISEPGHGAAQSLHKYEGYQVARSDEADSDSRLPSDETTASSETGPRQLLRDPLAWHLATCLVSTAVGGMYLTGTFKTFGLQTLSASSLAFISAIASIFNSVGRIFWGAFGDYVGALNALALLSLLFALTILTYARSLEFGETGFALWTFLVFFFEGGNFALYMPITIGMFGSKNASSNYGVIFSLFALSSVANITLLSHLAVDFHHASLYMGTLTSLGFLNVVLFIRHSTALTSGGPKDHTLGACKAI